jgi:diadenylate cyclase
MLSQQIIYKEEVCQMSLVDVFESIVSIIKTAKWVDILDIFLLSYIVYSVIKMVRETRAGQLMKGLLVCLVAFLIASWLDMKVITYLLTKAFDIGLLALVIMFQPELRRALEKAGHGRWGLNLGFNRSATESAAMWNNAIDAICDSCVELSATYTGALIVVERQTKLGEQIDNGTVLNAQPSKEIFGNIFYPKTPLHDGAVIMRDGMIMAAACFLPKPQKEELVNKKLGSRHRAAIGMSENSDAIVIVVSEETGSISVAENGVLTSGFTRERLSELLHNRLIEPDEGSVLVKATKHISHIAKRKGRDK